MRTSLPRAAKWRNGTYLRPCQNSLKQEIAINAEVIILVLCVNSKQLPLGPNISRRRIEISRNSMIVTLVILIL